jgi:hypothetical protein
MPTRFGNILKSAEQYPLLRYNLDAVIQWPRLYQVLPADFRTNLASAKTALDVGLVVALLSGVFAMVTGAYIVFENGPIWLFLACWVGGGVLALLAYGSACSNATVYAEYMRVAFDLYRHDIFKTLRLKAPTNLLEEEAIWRELDMLFYRSVREHPDKWQYEKPS